MILFLLLFFLLGCIQSHYYKGEEFFSAVKKLPEIKKASPSIKKSEIDNSNSSVVFCPPLYVNGSIAWMPGNITLFKIVNENKTIYCWVVKSKIIKRKELNISEILDVEDCLPSNEKMPALPEGCI